jgi:capsular polysaccharide biosynthesis protein
MTPLPHNKSGSFSEGLFQRLLSIYPKAHRDEFGPSMNQLFRDQCRDAWRTDHNWGLIKLWGRVLPDLVRTSMIEHLSAFKEKSMNERISHLLRSSSTPKKAFVAAFGGIFVVVLAASVLITFLLPESYGSVARIRIEPVKGRPGIEPEKGKPADPYHVMSQIELLQSDVILGKVVEELNLKEEWGLKYSAGVPLKASEAVVMLRSRVGFYPIRNTQLVEIRSFSDNPREAARVANAIAETYKMHSMQFSVAPVFKSLAYPADIVVFQSNQARITFPVEIVDSAVPTTEPVRPRKALNICVGAMIGILLGLVCGGGIGGIAFLLGRNARKNPA